MVLPLPLDPFHPFFCSSNLSEADRAAVAVAGQGRAKQLDETTRTDTNGKKRFEPVHDGESARMESSISLVGERRN
jgi:hypothetical protein